MFLRRDPGPCPVDDAAHTSCCAPAPTGIVVVQLPARDGVVDPPIVGALAVPPLAGEVPTAPTRAEQLQATLPPGQFTTGTYRRKKGSR
jgi:hypothetical protein